MFNIGFTEFLVIGAIALIFIGPKQLPEVARAVGRFMNELKRASDEALSVFRETKNSTDEFFKTTADEIRLLETDIDDLKIKKSPDKKLSEDKGDT